MNKISIILSILFIIPSLIMKASDNLVSYYLCETKDQAANTYRKQLKIQLPNTNWSASLQENMLSYTTKQQTLLDEKTGRYLLALAHAIKPGEDIIKDQATIQQKLNGQGLGREGHWWVALQVTDDASSIERSTTFEMPNHPNISFCKTMKN